MLIKMAGNFYVKSKYMEVPVHKKKGKSGVRGLFPNVILQHVKYAKCELAKVCI